MDQKLQLCTFLSSNDFSCKKTLTLPNLRKHLTVFTIHSPKCLTHTKGFAGMPPAWQGNGGSVAVFFLFTLSEFVRDFLNIRPPARSGSKQKSGVFFKVLLTKQSTRKLLPRMAGARSGRGHLQYWMPLGP